ncbi:hypothetical protein [Neomoorella thermoacetica]|nr:hypothetical protein [Moorella thermoacetica]
MPLVNSFAELQSELDKKCCSTKTNLRYHQTLVKEAITSEKQHLTPLPAREFEYARTRMAKVNSLSLFKLKSKRGGQNGNR